MRRIPALLASGLLLAACQLQLPSGSTGATTSATGSSGAGGAGGSASATPCDGKNNCDTCKSCSLNVQCAMEAAACQQSSACVGIDQCFAGCGSDAACQQQCYLLGPDGEAAYRALRACILCDACPSDCAGFTVCK
jgi:hypothetical protein